MATIGIVGFKADSHVRSLLEAIQRRGAKAVVIDFYNFPRFNLLFLGEASCYDDIHLEDPVRLAELDLMFIRNFHVPAPVAAAGIGQGGDHALRAQEAASLQYTLVRMAQSRIPVINSLEAAVFHRLKSWQYFALQKHGLAVPRTLTTNNSQEIEAFLEDFPGGVVAKPQTSGAEVVIADRDFIARNEQTLRARPMVFQQYVRGRSLRAYCLGGRIVSIGEIIHDGSRVDWRAQNVVVGEYTPSENLRCEIEKATRLLGLAFCSVDLEYDAPTGRHYLLDFSPAPLFSGWSRLSGDEISLEIADYLLSVIANGGALWQDRR